MASAANDSPPHHLLCSLLSVATLFTLLPIISAIDSADISPNTAISAANANPYATFILTSCNVTLYPDVCYTTLSPYANSIQQNSSKLAKVSIKLSLIQARQMAAHVADLSRQTNTAPIEPRAAAALRDCYSTFGDAVDLIQQSCKEMKNVSTGEADFRFRMANVQTWMSAALTNEDTCTDGFEAVSNSTMKADVIDKADYVKKLTSNALALVNNYVEGSSVNEQVLIN